jgi:5'-3' exonuclease
MYTTGRLKTLSTVVNGIERDVSIPYFVLKDIEKLRKQFTSDDMDLVVSICFDSPNIERKSEDSEYKANRNPNRLCDNDFENIKFIRETLEKCGYNTFSKESTEADDVIYTLVEDNKDKFDYTVICTPDMDLMLNICSKVGVYRYKTGKGFTAIDSNNLADYCSQELKCDIKYNTIMLYKCTVGDKSDNISGIFRFGPVKYNELIYWLEDNGFEDWDKLANKEVVESVIEGNGYLTESQKQQALESLALIVPKKAEGLSEPIEVSNSDKIIMQRNSTYKELNMVSLIQ